MKHEVEAVGEIAFDRFPAFLIQRRAIVYPQIGPAVWRQKEEISQRRNPVLVFGPRLGVSLRIGVAQISVFGQDLRRAAGIRLVAGLLIEKSEKVGQIDGLRRRVVSPKHARIDVLSPVGDDFWISLPLVFRCLLDVLQVSGFLGVHWLEPPGCDAQQQKCERRNGTCSHDDGVFRWLLMRGAAAAFSLAARARRR